MSFTGRHAEYTQADTWYPSWASDGTLYSPFTDGKVADGKGGEVAACSAFGQNASTGYAKITGDDPLHLSVTPLGIHPASALPYGGRYPCGTLVHDGIWYFGTYGLDHGPLRGWDILGPFVGFHISRDFGKTWTDVRTAETPLFGESGKNGGKIRIGSPHFVDFGRNMEHSPDGKAYLVAHGATRPDSHLCWISGDQIYLIRVVATPETINDPAQYEFFAGRDAQGRPVWSRRFQDLKPMLEWNDHFGCVTMTWAPALKRYLMCVTHGWPESAAMDTLVLESREITGPWNLVTSMKRFGEQAYFVNFPSKFIGRDGRTAWLCYSANYSNAWGGGFKADPPGGRYGMCLQEVRLHADSP